MLIEHGIDHVHEGFICRKEAMTACEEVALEHPFHRALAEHLDYPPVGREFAAVRVFREVFGDPEFLADFIDVVQLVGCVLIGTEDTEAIHVRSHNISQEGSQRARVLSFDLSRFIDLQAVGAEIGQA